MEYSKRARIIVAIDSFMFTLGMIIAFLIIIAPKSLVGWFMENDDLDELSRKRDKGFIETILVIIGAVLVIFLLFNWFMVIILFFGIKQKSVSKLRTWYITTCILTGLIIFETIFVTWYWGWKNIFTTKIPNVIFIIYRIISIHVIREFIKETKSYTSYEAKKYFEGLQLPMSTAKSRNAEENLDEDEDDGKSHVN